MRKAGLVVGETLELLRSSVRAGITTGELDAIAEDNIRSSGATPSFKGYHGFPGSICASVNDEVVHGIPGDRTLAAGRRDLHRLRRDRRRLARRRRDHGGRRRRTRRGDRADAGHRGGDVARDRRRPPRRPGHRHLARRRDPPAVARPLRDPRGLRRSRHRLGDAPAAERPQLRPARPRAQAGRRGWPWPSSRWSRSVARRPSLLDDDWTVVTADGSWAAHFEHTFTLTSDGAWVLTALDGGETVLAELGVPFGGPVSRPRSGPIRAAHGRRETMAAQEGSIPPQRRRQYGADLGPGPVPSGSTRRASWPRSSGRDLRRQNSSVPARDLVDHGNSGGELCR